MATLFRCCFFALLQRRLYRLQSVVPGHRHPPLLPPSEFDLRHPPNTMSPAKGSVMPSGSALGTKSIKQTTDRPTLSPRLIGSAAAYWKPFANCGCFRLMLPVRSAALQDDEPWALFPPTRAGSMLRNRPIEAS